MGLTPYSFSSYTNQRQRWTPGSFSHGSELNSNFSISIGIPWYWPIEAQVELCGMFDGKLAGDGGILSWDSSAGEEYEAENTNMLMHDFNPNYSNIVEMKLAYNMFNHKQLSVFQME